MYLWRAVDDEGEVLDLVVQKARDTGAALKRLRRLLRNQPIQPERITTDGLKHFHHPGRLRENSHLPIRRRERKTYGSEGPASAPGLPHHARGDLQYLLHPASPHQLTNAEVLRVEAFQTWSRATCGRS